MASLDRVRVNSTQVWAAQRVESEKHSALWVVSANAYPAVRGECTSTKRVRRKYSPSLAETLARMTFVHQQKKCCYLSCTIYRLVG